VSLVRSPTRPQRLCWNLLQLRHPELNYLLNRLPRGEGGRIDHYRFLEFLPLIDDTVRNLRRQLEIEAGRHAPARLRHNSNAAEKSAINPKERDTLLMLVCVLAVKYHGYLDPKKGRHAVSGVLDDLAELSLELDEKTVRNKFKAALARFGDDLQSLSDDD
jgi:hypothetical protein